MVLTVAHKHCPACVYVAQVYCEMTIDGGGYTFVNPLDMDKMNNADLETLVTDSSSFLLSLQRINDTQLYGVARQLSIYA
jgi:hypothetical protein